MTDTLATQSTYIRGRSTNLATISAFVRGRGTLSYITLANSAGGISYKFRAIGLRMPLIRTDSIDYTLGGKIDKQAGSIFKFFEYVLRVPLDTQLNNYGCYQSLVDLYMLNNPNASPSDVITLVDHFGDPHSVFFLGEQIPEPLTTMLEGVSGWHIVPIRLQEIP